MIQARPAVFWIKVQSPRCHAGLDAAKTANNRGLRAVQANAGTSGE